MPFLLKVHCDEAARASEVAEALRRALAAQGARFALESGPRGLPGLSVGIGLWDVMGNPRWLAPVEAEGGPDEAAARVLAFLESWGFVARHLSGPADGPAPAS